MVRTRREPTPTAPRPRSLTFGERSCLPRPSPRRGTPALTGWRGARPPLPIVPGFEPLAGASAAEHARRDSVREHARKRGTCRLALCAVPPTNAAVARLV